MHPKPASFHPARASQFGFTLAEVVMSLAIIATVFGGMIMAYIQATKRAQWSGYSLAAQALSIQQIEQVRSASWDPAMNPYRNQLTNLVLSAPSLQQTGAVYTFTGYSSNVLDLPTTGTNFVPAINYVTVRMFFHNGQTNPGVRIQLVKVDTVWPFRWNNTTKLFTNSICTYVAPDNRDVDSLFY